MSQEEIEKCLMKSERPMTAKEIAEELGIDKHKKIYPLINKLLRWNEIYSMELSSELAMKKYNCKRRMCVYSYKEEWFSLI